MCSRGSKSERFCLHFGILDKNLLINAYQSKTRQLMKGISDYDEPLFSPTHFILRTPDAQPFLPDFDLPCDSEEKLPQSTIVVRTSVREEKKRLAGAKSREKKKQYVQKLEDRVKELAVQVEDCELQLSKTKDELVKAIQTSTQHTNQHAYIFTELENNLVDQDPDLDKVNLLLDIIQTRCGANSSERQANLDYSFKQMINSILPAMHRYLMHSATHGYDLFDPSLSTSSLMLQNNWTNQLYTGLALNESQLEFIRNHEDKMIQKRREAIEVIRRLKTVKEEMKMQEEIFQQKILEIKSDMTPVQSGLMAVFGQKNKLRRQFAIGEVFYEEHPIRKKIKTQ